MTPRCNFLVEYGVLVSLAAVVLGGIFSAYVVRQIRRRSQQQFDYVSTARRAALVMGLVDALFSGTLPCRTARS